MRLSIITINLNNLAGLRKTIESVIAQTWQDYEWIIVDGGSSDGSRELIEKYQKKFVCWCSETDSGIYNAMNKGILQSRGDYCLFLNSGDWFCNNKVLEKAFSKKVDKDIVSFDQLLETSSGKVEYICKLERFPITASTLILGTLPHQATLIRRQYLLDHGLYDESLRIVSDWKFFLQAIVFENASFEYHSLPFSFVQREGISLRNDEERDAERSSVLKEFFPQLVLDDYSQEHSLSYVLRASRLCRYLYGLLFRLADLTYRLR